MQALSSEGLSTTPENRADLMLSGKEGRLAPNENGENRNELGALGYSHQQHESGCMGNATQFLGLLLFFSVKFQTGLHRWNETAYGRPAFRVLGGRIGPMDLELQREGYLVIYFPTSHKAFLFLSVFS